MRRAHPGWGPRAIGHQLALTGMVPVPCRSSIYRGAAAARADRSCERSDYRRWERSWAMELWQLDVTGGAVLVTGLGCGLLTGVDDQSRFCVSATVLVRPTATAGVSDVRGGDADPGGAEQVPTDDGKSFTGRTLDDVAATRIPSE